MNNLQTLSLDSREVAKMLEKEHKHLLRDISVYAEYLIQSKVGLNEFFQAATYKDKIGRTLRSYKITKKGCEFLAHKQTGRKGAIFTASYVQRFHEMEAKLKQLPKQQTLIEEPYKPSLKYYRGIPVVTKLDIAMLLGVDRSVIQSYIRRPWFMVENIDFFLLRGRELVEFRRENGIRYVITSLLVLTESGVRKIYEARMEEFKEDVLFPKPVQLEAGKQELVLDIPVNVKIQDSIDVLRKKLTALDVTLLRASERYFL